MNAVAAAAGVDQEPGRSIEDTLERALARAELPLLLDDCEHVAAAASGLVERLLGSCPGLTILATSRVALKLDRAPSDAEAQITISWWLVAGATIVFLGTAIRWVSDVRRDISNLPLDHRH